jgi:transposase
LVRKYKDNKFGEADTKALLDLDTKELTKENEKLKTRLGEKDLEIAILRDLIKKKNPHLLKKLK